MKKRQKGPNQNPKINISEPKKFLGITNFGFSKKNEVFVGRTAQLGFLASVIGEKVPFGRYTHVQIICSSKQLCSLLHQDITFTISMSVHQLLAITRCPSHLLVVFVLNHCLLKTVSVMQDSISQVPNYCWYYCRLQAKDLWVSSALEPVFP